MNILLDLYNELLELQRLAREGVSIDDVKVESVMQSIRQIHDQGVDNNPFLDKEQKKRRKDLYAKAVKETVDGMSNEQIQNLSETQPNEEPKLVLQKEASKLISLKPILDVIIIVILSNLTSLDKESFIFPSSNI